MEGNYRIVYTKFWRDNFISNLDPLDRYIFLYFLTNEHTNLAGIYELPIKIIEFETGLEKEVLRVIMGRLLEKIDYFEGWVIIKNYPKYQNLLKSPNIRISIKNILDELPKNLIGYLKGIKTLYKLYAINSRVVVEKSSSRVEKKKRENFIPPSLEEVTNYCLEQQNGISPQGFIDFYESKGWFIGRNKMVSWKAAVRNWEGRDKEAAGKEVINVMKL